MIRPQVNLPRQQQSRVHQVITQVNQAIIQVAIIQVSVMANRHRLILTSQRTHALTSPHQIRTLK